MFDWLKKIFKLGPTSKDTLWLHVKCLKCDNVLRICIHPSTDLIPGYSEDEPPYRLHKETVDGKCFNTIIIDIKYDNSYQPLEKDISGAEFIDEKKY